MIGNIFAVIIGLFLWLLAMGLIVLILALPFTILFFLIKGIVSFFRGRNDYRDFVRDYKQRDFSEEDFIPLQTDPAPYAKTSGRTREKPAVKKEEQPQEEEKKDPFADTVRSLLDANNAIHHPEINQIVTQCTEKLKLLETLQIPSEKTDKMFRIYLPSLTSILQGYARLETSGNAEELERMREKILRIATLINDALDNMISDITSQNRDVLDSDIHQLETLLKNDGVVNQMHAPFQK